MSLWKSIKAHWLSNRLPPEVLLADQLAENQYHPYQIRHIDKYDLKTRYATFYVSILGCFVCGLVIAVWIVLGLVNQAYLSSPFFLIPFFLLAITIAGILNYADVKHYKLYPRENLYSFSYNDNEQIRGDYHNIYIRLRRDVRTSTTKWYYLVLKGYQMEKLPLCKPSTNVEELRKLGQQIATNLNINYFDEANISKHHVIRHTRSDKNLFSFRK